MNYSKLLLAAKEKYKKGTLYRTKLGIEKVIGEIKWNKGLTAIKCSCYGVLYDTKTQTWAEIYEDN